MMAFFLSGDGHRIVHLTVYARHVSWRPGRVARDDALYPGHCLPIAYVTLAKVARQIRVSRLKKGTAVAG